MQTTRGRWTLAVAAGAILSLLAPTLVQAGPVGELVGPLPVVGPIVDPDDDGNADLPVLSEDLCEGHDDAVDQDGDRIPDACDADRDGDGVDNDSDLWPDDPSQTVDSDGDGVSDERDACEGHDDAVDQDGDRIPDACDADRDGDGVDNDSDLWPDDPSQTVDSDGDGVSDERDACEGHDDAVDQDGDGTPDGCDADRDGDGVDNDDDFRPDDPDRWSDDDLDGIADQLDDVCLGHDDTVDQDRDHIPDGCDPDRDGDGVPNDGDLWPDDPTRTVDSDGDGIADEVDACPGHDDGIDQDEDRIPDACDADRDGDGVDNDGDLWPDDPSQTIDSDGDGVSDERDACPGHDDAVDQDEDLIPDACDPDRDGDEVDNDDDLWPDDPTRSVAAQAIDVYGTELRAGNRAADGTPELSVLQLDQTATVGQHAWASGSSAALIVSWDPTTRRLSLEVGADAASTIVPAGHDVRAARIRVTSAKASMTATLSGLTVNGVAQVTGPISATNTSVERSFGSLSWGQGLTLTGSVTFSHPANDAAKNNELKVEVLLGR